MAEIYLSEFTGLLSILVGALIALFVSMLYYKQASKELIKETTELRRLNNLMLRGMEEAGWVELNKDERGNIKGYKLKLSGTVNAKSKVTGNLTVKNKTQFP